MATLCQVQFPQELTDPAVAIAKAGDMAVLQTHHDDGAVSTVMTENLNPVRQFLNPLGQNAVADIL